MNGDPKRWTEDGGDAPLGARELLRAASRPQPMSAAEFARTAARVAPLGTAAGAGATVPMWVKGLLLAVGLGVGGAGLQAALDERSDAAAVPQLTDLPLEGLLSRGVPAVAPAPLAPAPADPLPVAPPARREPARPPRPAVVATAATAEADDDTLAREAFLLKRARAALDQDPAAALATLDEHQTSFPHGKLVEEREFLKIRVLMRLGRVDEARTRADVFFARYPSSSFAHQARRLVNATPANDAPSNAEPSNAEPSNAVPVNAVPASAAP